MKKLMNKFSILTIALIGGLTMTGCMASDRSANDKASPVGGYEQAESSNTADKKADNKSAELEKSTEDEVLWDFRKSEYVKNPNASKAETDAVLKYLLNNDTWDKDLSITSRVSGAFTKANAKETLYFVTGCKDGENFVSNATCGHAGWNTDGRIAIFDGTTPVTKIETALGYGILKVTDVNGDGINEILSTSGYAQSGIQFEVLSLGQISGGKYKDIKTLRGYIDNCAFGDTLSADKKQARAVAVNYLPSKDGKMPEFKEEYFQGQCKNDEVDKSSWKGTTKKVFEEFYDAHS